MAMQLRSTTPITAWNSSEGAIVVAVSSGGSDADTVGRPPKILSGDYSSLPFATPQAALDALPKVLNHDIIVRIGAGAFAGVVAHGFVGKGRLRIAGTKTIATLPQGATSGTAGAGTTTTTMNKPGAAANWNVDLRGRFLVITGGGGASGDSDFPTVRPIKSSTTTSLTVDPIPGMDATSQFQIVDVTTILNAAPGTVQGISMRYGVLWCQASVETTFLKLHETVGGAYGALFWNTQSATMSGCDLAASSGTAASAISCTEVFVDNVLLDGTFSPFVVQRLSMQNAVIQSNGGLSAQHISRGTIVADSYGTLGTAIKVQDSVMVTLAANLNQSAVVPLDLQNIHNFRIDGYLTGVNPTPTRGMVISRGGQYVITGATLAGSSSDQFELEGRPGSYAELSGANSGTYSARGSHLHWGANPLYTVVQTKFRVEGGEPGDAFDEFIAPNIVIGGTVKHYGVWQYLDPAYKEVTAFAGGGQANATVVGYAHTRIATVASAGDSVRLLSTSEIAYVGGMPGTVHNAGANAANLFPPSGKKIFLNGVTDLGADTAVSLPANRYAVWISRNDTHYSVWILGTASGPSSSTANAIPKFNGTSGQLLADSGVTIDSANGISGHTEVQNVITGTTYTIQASDTGKVLIFTNAAAVTVTVPASLTAGWHCRWEQRGAGKVSFNGVAVAAATLRNRQTHNASAGQYAVGGLACYTTGDVTLFGDTGT